MGKTINSFKEFHRRIPEIVEQLNADEALCIRAAVNPILAFEELGYKITPSIQKEVERYIRFKPKERKRIRELETQIRQEAGVDFDIDSPKELDRVLFKKLELHQPSEIKTTSFPDVMTSGAKSRKEMKRLWKDPVSLLEQKHPILEPLLAYRELQILRPGFASRKVYQELKTKKRKLPVTRFRIRFPDQPRHEEVEDA
jgi:hypothetical protein